MMANPEVLGASAPTIQFISRQIDLLYLPIANRGYGATAAGPLLLDEEAVLKQAFSIEQSRRDKAASAFATKASERPEVLEVWRVDDGEPMVVAVVVSEMTLDEELELRAQFAAFTQAHDAELRVYSETDSRVGLARRGKPLPLG